MTLADQFFGTTLSEVPSHITKLLIDTQTKPFLEPKEPRVGVTDSFKELCDARLCFQRLLKPKKLICGEEVFDPRIELMKAPNFKTAYNFHLGSWMENGFTQLFIDAGLVPPLDDLITGKKAVGIDGLPLDKAVQVQLYDPSLSLLGFADLITTRNGVIQVEEIKSTESQLIPQLPRDNNIRQLNSYIGVAMERFGASSRGILWYLIKGDSAIYPYEVCFREDWYQEDVARAQKIVKMVNNNQLGKRACADEKMGRALKCELSRLCFRTEQFGLDLEELE